MQWFNIEIEKKIVLESKINYQNYQSLIFPSKQSQMIWPYHVIDFKPYNLLGTSIKNYL